MNYVDECNAYAVAAAKLAGKYEFLIAMQEDVRRVFMPELESISEYELRQQLEAEYASYLAMMEEQYEIDGQVNGEPRTPAKAAEAVGKEVHAQEERRI